MFRHGFHPVSDKCACFMSWALLYLLCVTLSTAHSHKKMTDLEQVTALADSYHLPLVFGEIKASSGSFLFLDYVLEKLSVLQSVCPSFVQRISSEPFNIFEANLIWWRIIVRWSAKLKCWGAIFSFKWVTVMNEGLNNQNTLIVWIIKIYYSFCYIFWTKLLLPNFVGRS